MDRFLIIGSNSFSGSHFCRKLLKQGFKVFGISRSAEPSFPFTPYLWDENPPKNFQFQQLDINSELNEFCSILSRFKPHYIINFAAQSMVAQSWECPQDWLQTNVMAVTNIAGILKNYDGLEKFVQVTTPEVYGSTKTKIDEDACVKPSTPYAVSRAAGDMMLKIYQEQFGLPVNFTRAANVYGAGQKLYRIIPRTILACLTNQKLVLDGGGLSKRAFIHIDDVCEATLLAARVPVIGETYHISTDEFVSIKTLVEKIVSTCGSQFDDVVELGTERLGKDNAYFLESAKIRERLGWSENVSLDNGIRETINWMNKYLETFRSMEVGYVHRP